MMYAMVDRSGLPDGFPATVGVIGLGVMGTPMAHNLLGAAGSDAKVIVHHRSADRVASLIADGATWVATPRELAHSARVILLMLPDLPQVEEVLAGPDGLLAGIDKPTTLIIGSTSSAEGVRALATTLARATKGLASVVDAPVSGGEDGAIAGTLAIMVGGDDDIVAGVLPMLAAMGTPIHLGPLGAGEIAKFCNQLIVASTIFAIGEAAVLADRSGIDLQAMFDLLESGYAGSRVLETRKQRVIDEDYAPSGVAKYMVKDLGFALDEAKSNGTALSMTRRLLGSFEDLVARGFGDLDIAVTRAYVESKSTSRQK